MEDYSNFINDVSLYGNDYSDVQWRDADSLYLLYSVEYYEKYKPELTQEERKRTNELTGEYFALRSISVGKGILTDIEDFGIQMESMLNTFINELQIDTNKIK